MLNFVKQRLIAAGQLLPAGTRRSLFHFAFNCAPDEFEKFAYLYANAPNQETLLRAVAARGFSPQRIVDVGAYEGGWSRMARSIWPNSRIIMIEANQEQKATLQSVATELDALLFCELLGASDGQEIEFHVMATGSSVLPERSDVPRKSERRRLTTLDSLLAEHGAVDFLKLDVQGYELAVLTGAGKILPAAHLVLLEIALIELNDGSPNLHDVIAYMHKHGFVALDILEIHRRPADRALWQIDVLFCREDAELRANKWFR